MGKVLAIFSTGGGRNRRATVKVVSTVAAASLVGAGIVIPLTASADDALGGFKKITRGDLRKEVTAGTYGNSSWNGYDTKSYKGDLEEAERRVKIEALSDENDNFEQRWRITWNDKNFWMEPGKKPYKGSDYNQGGFKANPYLAFMLSDDLSVVGDVHFKVYDRYKDNNPNPTASQPGTYDGPLKQVGNTEYYTSQIWNRYDQDRLQGNLYLQRKRNLTRGTDNVQDLQSALNATDASISYFRFNKTKTENLAHGDPNLILNDVGTIYGTYLYTGKSYGYKSAKVTLEFTTKRDPKRFYEGHHRTFVAGEYNSWDWNDDDIRVVSMYRDNDTATDTDGDGLPDAFEVFIGSNPRSQDTDGDGKTDSRVKQTYNAGSHEAVDPAVRQFENLWKVPGTDPVQAPPTLPDRPFFGIQGEKITGTAAPNTTIAIWAYKDGVRQPTALAETVSDSQGRYTLEMGKVLKRIPQNQNGGLNQWNNSIVLKNNGNPDSSGSFQPEYQDGYRDNSQYLSAENRKGVTLELTQWSDGFDGRPLFSEPELARERGNLVDLSKPFENFGLDPKIPVENPSELTQAEKDKIKDALAKNDKIKDAIKGTDENEKKGNLEVDKEGNVTVTLVDGTKQQISKDKIVAQSNVAQKPTIVAQDGKILANPSTPDREKITVNNVDPVAKQVVLKNKQDGQPDTDLVTFTKGDNGAWSSSDPAYTAAPGGNGSSLIITPNDATKTALQNKNLVVTAKAKDSDNGQTSDPVLYDVTAPRITNPDTANFTQNNKGDVELVRDDNAATVTLKDGQRLPDGLSLTGNATDGFKISGTPTTKLDQPSPVIFEITDPNGNKSEKTVNVSVAEQQKTPTPAIDSVKKAGENYNVAVSTAPKAQVEVTLPDKTKLSGKADDQGKITFNVPAGKLNGENKNVSVTATDTENGKAVSDPANKDIDTAAPESPTVDDLVAGANKVLVTPPADAQTVTVNLPGNKTVTLTKQPDGSWKNGEKNVTKQGDKLEVPVDGTLNKGDTVTATATDETGNTSTPASKTVAGKPVDPTHSEMKVTKDGSQDDQNETTVGTPVTVTVTPKASDDTATTLPGEPDTIKVNVPGLDGEQTLTKQPNGTYTGTFTPTKPAEDQNSKITFPDGTPLKGLEHKLVVNKQQTKQPSGSAAHTPTGTAVTVTPGEGESFKDGDKVKVTIPATGGGQPTEVEKTVGSGDGRIPVKDGKVTVDLGREVAPNTELSVTHTAGGKNESPAGTVTVPAQDQTGQPAVSGVTKKDDNTYTLTGTAPAGSKVKVTFPDGTTKETDVPDNGTFTVDLPKDKLTDKIQLTAKEPGKSESPATDHTVDTAAPAQPVVDAAVAGGDKITLKTPTEEDAAKITITAPGHTGDIVVTKDDKGTWTAPEGITVTPRGEKLEVALPNKEKLAEGKITAKVTDKTGNESPVGEATVTAPAVTKTPSGTAVQKDNGTELTLRPGEGESFTDGDTITIKVPGQADVTKTIGNGADQVKPGDDGSVKITVPKVADNTGVKVVHSAGGKAPSAEGTVTVPAQDQTPKPAVTSTKKNDDGSYTVTGTAPAGSEVTVTNGAGVNEKVPATDGTFTVTVPADKAGQELTLTAKEADKTPSAEEKHTIDTKAPDAPAVENVSPGDNKVLVTPPADADKITVTVGKGTPVVVTKKPGEGNKWQVEGGSEIQPNAAGKLEIPVTAVNKGDTVSVTAADKTGNTSEPTTKTVEGKPVDKDRSTITVTAGNAETSSVAAGTPVTVTVTPKDADGHNTSLPGEPASIQVTVPGVAEPVTLNKNDQGAYVGTATPGNPVADGAVTVTTDGPLKDKSTPLTVTDKSINNDNTTLTLTPSKTPTGEDGKAAEGTPVTVSGVVKDGSDPAKPIPGRNLTVEVKTGEGEPQYIPAKTDNNGNIVRRDNDQPVQFTAGNNGETSTVKVFDGDVNAENAASTEPVKTVTIEAGKNPDLVGKPYVPADKNGKDGSNVSVTTDPKKANNADPHTVTVTLKDKYGEPITGAENKLKLTTETAGYTADGDGKNITLNGFTAVKDQPGVYTATVTSSKVGTADLKTQFTEGDTTVDLPASTSTADNPVTTVPAAFVDLEKTATPTATVNNDGATTTVEVTGGDGDALKDGDTVKVTIPATNGGTPTVVEKTVGTGEGQVPVKDGKVTVDLGSKVPADTQLTVTHVATGKNPSDDATVRVPAPQQSAEPGDVQVKKDGDNYVVTGTAPAGSTVTLTKPNGEKVTVQVPAEGDNAGKFSFTVPATEVTGENPEVALTATEPGKTESQPVRKPVDNKAPAKPGLEDLVAGNTVTVTPPAGDDVQKITVTPKENGTPIELTKNEQNKWVAPSEPAGVQVVEKDGKLEVTVPEALVAGDKVTVTASDKTGNVSDPAEKTVPASAQTTAPSEISAEKKKDDPTKVVVSGKAPAGSTVVVKDKNGKEIGKGTADDQGKFTVDVPLSGVTDPIKVTATKPGETESAETPYTVDVTPPAQPDVVTPEVGSDKLLVTPPTDDATTITVTPPTGEPIVLTKDGDAWKKDGQPVPVKDGKLEITLPAPLEDGNQVTVTATDPAGNTSEPHTVTAAAPQPAAPVVDPSQSTIVVTTEGKEGNQDSVAAGTPITVTVTPKDKNNKPVDLGSSIMVNVPGVKEPVELVKQPDGSYKNTEPVVPETATTGDKDNKITFPEGSALKEPLKDKNHVLTVTPGAYDPAKSTAVVKHGDEVLNNGDQPAEGKTTPAGDPVIVVFTPTDAYGNKVELPEGTTVRVEVPRQPDSSNAATAVPVNLEKQADGTYQNTNADPSSTVTPTVVGENKLWVKTEKDDQTTDGPAPKITVVAGAPAGVTETGITGEKGKPITGQELTVTDKAGHPVTDGTKVYVKVPGSEEWQEVTVKDGKITVPEFTTDKNGEVQVATDNQGTNVIASVPVTVTDPAPAGVKATLTLTPATPVADGQETPVAGSDVTVGGTVSTVTDDSASGQPVADRPLTVTVKTGTGEEKTVQAKTDTEGHIVAQDGSPITFTAGNAGETTTVKVFDGASATGEPLASKEITAAAAPAPEVAAPAAPTITGATPSVVTGTVGESVPAGSTVTVKKDGQKIGEGTVDTTHGFTVSYEEGKAPAVGDQITATVTVQGKESAPSEPFTVTAEEPSTVLKPARPTDVVATTTTVTGKVDETVPAGSKVTVKDKDDQVIGEGEVTDNNDFEVTYQPGSEPESNDPVKVTVTDNVTQVESEPTPATVMGYKLIDPLVRPDTPSVDDGATVSTITGVASNVPAGSVVTVTDEHGTVIGTSATTPDGHFTVTIDKDKQPQVGATVHVTVTDAETQEVSEPATVERLGADPVTPQPSVPVKPAAPGSVVATGTTVTGKVDGSVPVGSTVTVTDEHGAVIGTGVVADDHTFTVTVDKDKQPAVGSTVTVTVTDKNTGLTSDPSSVVVGSGKPAAARDVVVSEDGRFVTGHGVPGLTVTVTMPDGTVLTGVVGEDGSFSVAVPGGVVLKPGDRVTVVLTDGEGRESDPVSAVVPGEGSFPWLPVLGGAALLGGSLVNHGGVTGSSSGAAPAAPGAAVHTPGVDNGIQVDAQGRPVNGQGGQGDSTSARDSVAGQGARAGKSESKGWLANTGASVIGVTAIGLLLAVAGVVLMVARRRKEN